jgi:UDP-N-acetylmuramoylalanine--D-glutamate ligase
MAVLGRDDPGSWNLRSLVPGQWVSFGHDQPPAGETGTYFARGSLYHQQGTHQTKLMDKNILLLRGDHNLLNALAACAIASAAGFPLEAMVAGITDFKGVAHRLEYVRAWNGATWYNDSIATAPERTMAAIRAFSEPLVLLLGGRDKNLPWQDLATLIHERVEHVVVFGEAAPKILAAIGPLQSGRKPFTLEQCAGLQEAVTAAARLAEDGVVVLLSPGGTSFDEFHDFEARGEAFRTWVHQLS